MLRVKKLSHRHKTIILYFLTTTCRSCSLVKLHVWINHVDTWRRFNDDIYNVYQSMQLHIAILCINIETTMSVSKGMQLNSVKSIFLGFCAMFQSSYTVMYKKYWKTSISYSAFCITPFKDCLLLMLIKKYW